MTPHFVRLLLTASQLLLIAPELRADTEPGRGARETRLLSFHERNYFISSFGATDAVKFQLSLKYNLWPIAFDPESPFDGPRHGVYFAFSQRALWDIYDLKNSSAIASMDFRPELFYRFGHSGPRERGCRFWSANLGIQHISNGESGEQSRSVNWATTRLLTGCAWPHVAPAFSPFLRLQLDLWSPPVRPVENPEIVDYMGLVRAELTFSTNILDSHSRRAEHPRWYGHLEVSGALRPGWSQTRFNYELEGVWRPGYPEGWLLTPYLYAQYWNGYGETLLNYDRRTQHFRIGFGFYDTLIP